MPIDLNAPPPKPPTECEKKFGDIGGTITTRSANITNLEAALKYSKVDLTIWEVERHEINSWEVTISGHRSSTERDQTYTNYQVKVWLRRKSSKSVDSLALQFRALAEKHSPRRFIRPKKVSGKYLYELGIADVHLGKLAHSAETGWQNYDCKIAAAEYRAASDSLLARTPQGVEKIAIIFGNDQFNADNESNQTTAGTPQDCDGRFGKVYRLGTHLSTELVEKALSIAPVHVVIVPGNHDHLTSFHLGEFLRAWFRHSKHVTIDNANFPRKYLHYGSNLIGYTHGDRRHELKMLPNLMAKEQRHIWNQVRHTEWRVHHWHQLKMEEIVGTVIRTLSALCPPDKWHADNGFVGGRQGAQGFSWHRTRGLEETFWHNIVSEPVKR